MTRLARVASGWLASSALRAAGCHFENVAAAIEIEAAAIEEELFQCGIHSVTAATRRAASSRLVAVAAAVLLAGSNLAVGFADIIPHVGLVI